MTDRVSSRLLMASPVLVLLGVMTLWLSEAGSGEYWSVVKWYWTDQIGRNRLFWPTAALAGLATLGWGLVALRERWRLSRDLGGGPPLKHHGVVDEATLARRAFALLQPELSRSKPRIERALDALLGATVDLGASELRLEPDGEWAEVLLVIGMDKLSVTRISSDLHRALVHRLTVMLALEGQEGRGSFRLRSGASVEPINVRLRRSETGVRVRLRLASRARRAITLPHLGLSKSALERLRRQLRADCGLIVVCSRPRHGATTTLYAAGHYVHHSLGLKPGKVALIEPHVSLGVPFMYQAEAGSRPLSTALKTLVRGSFRVFLLRSVADSETARLVVQTARQRLVVVSIEADDIAAGLYRLARWVGAEPLQQTLSLALAQRLLPRLCRQCREPIELTERQRGLLGRLEIDGQLFHAAGGDCCDGRGERGLQPLFWLLEPESWLFEGLGAGLDPAGLRSAAQRAGSSGALSEALELARRGDISAETLTKLAAQGVC